ncbi:3-dehydroquinate synthase homolog isoform X2 [Tripterygium wilfordii]|uniref:3-dehydroquinate synthase homolog isoform X2 n=1 Tax=Tripterygium wilfordii TaxID=458696 RepID=UPI0018F85BE4|nr:3-dehydroquinate synthase homolog isoform X2 [Tripterygium wilfordii]
MFGIAPLLPGSTSTSTARIPPQLPCFTLKTEKWSTCRLVDLDNDLVTAINYGHLRKTRISNNSFITRYSSASTMASGLYDQSKRVWIWTKSKQVMTAAVERGWNTFLFSSKNRQLADEWSSMALIEPLFIEEADLLDSEHKRVATILAVSTPQELEKLQPENWMAENVLVDLLDWQIIPAENIVAAFQGSQKTVFAVSERPSEAQIFLEDYFDRRNEESNVMSLAEATVTRIEVARMGDRVCVDLCSLMRPGEGLLVGSFARGLFLVHSECLESNYIASRPFRVNAGPVHTYVAIPGGKTSYLSELRAGKEVIVVDQKGRQRTAIVGRVKIETRSLVLVEAKGNSDDQTVYSIFLQNAETVGLVCPCEENKPQKTAVPVTSLKVGDKVLLRVQGGARHTGIEIQEFIVEN